MSRYDNKLPLPAEDADFMRRAGYDLADVILSPTDAPLETDDGIDDFRDAAGTSIAKAHEKLAEQLAQFRSTPEDAIADLPREIMTAALAAARRV